jgi:cell division protein FtsL
MRAEPAELPLTKKKRQETSVPRKKIKKILGIFKIFLGIFIAGT